MSNEIIVKLGQCDFFVQTIQTELEKKQINLCGGEKEKDEIKRFDIFLDLIQQISSSLNDKFRALKSDERPTKITASFGISFSANGNLILVNSTAEANMNITVEWNDSLSS